MLLAKIERRGAAISELSFALVRAVETIGRWSMRSRERRLLGALPERLLKDIGISRCDQMAECEKPFWSP